VIAVVSTMDTKGREAEFLRKKITESGHRALVIDVSTLGQPVGAPDISSETVLSKAPEELRRRMNGGAKEDIVAAMAEGAAHTLVEQVEQGHVDGVIGIGGNQGSAIAATAMRALPLGFPKFLVSTVASQNIRPFVGHKDIAVVFAVSDFVGGTNFVSESILANSAAAVVGMVDSGRKIERSSKKKTIAISALGNTERAVNRAVERLQALGYETVAFHASGAGGSAMEELIDAGMIDAVLELTPHEVTEEVMGVGIYVPVRPGRLTAAIRQGIPLVLATGGMEYICFGPRASIPQALQRRNIYMHNPYNANLQIDHQELQKVAKELSTRLNQSRGKVCLLVPQKGWSVYGAADGPFHDEEGIALFIDTVRDHLSPTVELRLLDYNINDPEFVDACVHRLLEHLE
jgi:uncharacterized protein (UPF0261 family)